MFWTNFEYLCRSIGKSPNAVALELKLAPSSVSAWRKGAQPRMDTLLKIANYFAVDADDLLKKDLKKAFKPVPTDEAELEGKFDIEIKDVTAEEAALIRAYTEGIKARRKL